jgi:hypothetical protein
LVGPRGMKISYISRIATVQDKIDIVLDFWNVIQTHCLKNISNDYKWNVFEDYVI